MDFLFRTATNDDLLEAKTIFEQCFDDTREFIDFFYKNRKNFETIVATSNDKIVGIAHLFKTHINYEKSVQTAYYLYAVGVAKNFRGKGFLARLLAMLKSKCDIEKSALLIKPANKKLSEIYKKLGVSQTIPMREILISSDTFQKNASIIDINVSEYKKLFDNSFLKKSSVTFDENYIKMCIDDIKNDGGFAKKVCTEDGDFAIVGNVQSSTINIYECTENALMLSSFFDCLCKEFCADKIAFRTLISKSNLPQVCDNQSFAQPIGYNLKNSDIFFNLYLD